MDRTLLLRAVADAGEWLRAEGRWLAGAESCTGGLIASTLTDVPGSSEWFKGCVVAYANEIKERVLGVPGAVLREHGAVSEACVRAMAEGAARALGADVAFAVSGIAGPGGGTAEKPVGTVWVGWYSSGKTRAKHYAFGGDRAQVKAQTLAAVVNGLLGAVK